MTIGLGIIGLPQSGKTTVFNALTRGQVAIVGAPSPGKPNIGIAKVPDSRLDKLTKMFEPQRVTPAQIQYVDFPVYLDGKNKARGIRGEMLIGLQQSNALVLVIRAFKDPSVSHPEGLVAPYRDIDLTQLELVLSDLVILERSQERLEKELKGAKASERGWIKRDYELISRIRSDLESNIPLRDQSLSSDERRSIVDYQFLTDKPLLILFNIGEEDLSTDGVLEQDLSASLGRSNMLTTAMCGKLEMELGQMAPEEEDLFRESMGAGESGAGKMIRLSHSLLGLDCFFTVGPDEVKAWTITQKEPASQAAGRIHSDIERGFIRAEVVSYDDLVRCGGIAESRRQGVFRSEGRTYPVQNGDVINFLFNV